MVNGELSMMNEKTKEQSSLFESENNSQLNKKGEVN